MSHVRRGLYQCARGFDETGLTEPAITRRAHIALNHTTSTPGVEIFGGSNTCVLNPEGEVGPFWISGELIRLDILEDQASVPVILDLQFVDVNSCQPVEGLYIDHWSCNSTGVYSGVSGNGNGNSADTSILQETFLRHRPD